MVEKTERLASPNRPVSILILRHFTPDQKYREDVPLTEKALEEAKEASRSILSQIQDGEVLVFYGADAKGRHRETQRLMEAELRRQIEEDNRDVQLLTPSSVTHKRVSLRGPGFTKEYVERAGGPKNLLSYWMTQEDSLGGQVQRPEELGKRLKRLIRKLVEFTRRTGFGPRCHWLVITSGELPASVMVKEFGVKGMNLEPGHWVRFDIEEGKSLTDVRMTHQQGQTTTIDLTKT